MSSSSSNNSNNSVGGDKKQGSSSSSSSSGSANANSSTGSSGSGNSDMATAAAGAAAGGGGGGGVGGGGGGAAIRDGARSRVRWNDEDGGDDSYYDIDDDPQMTRLLHRLRREHATNFGNHGGGGGGSGIGGESGSGGGVAAGSAGGDGCRVNRTRARYLLEASAGNVGLASALYWEDFLAESERRGGDSTTNSSATNATASQASGSSAEEGGGKKKVSFPFKGEGGNDDDNKDNNSTKKKRRHEDTGGVESDIKNNTLSQQQPQQKRYKRENSFGRMDSSGGNSSSSPFASSSAPTHHDDVVAARKMPHNDHETSATTTTTTSTTTTTTPRGKGMAKKGSAGSGPSSNRDNSLGLGSSSGAREEHDDTTTNNSNDDDVARMQNYLRGSSNTLSSMHQFQRQLDEKISSLQERLSSYRWQWQNDAAAAAAAGSAFAAPAAPTSADRLSSYRTSSQQPQPPHIPSSNAVAAAASSSASLGNPSNNNNTYANSLHMQAAIAALQLGPSSRTTTSTSTSGNISGGSTNNNNPSSVAAAVAYGAGPSNHLWNIDYLGDRSAFGLGPAAEDGGGEGGGHPRSSSALFDIGMDFWAGAGGGMMMPPPRMSMEEIQRAIQALQEEQRSTSAAAAAVAQRFANSFNASADAAAASLPLSQLQEEQRSTSAAAAQRFANSLNASADMAAASLPLSQMNNFGFGPPPFDWLSRTMPYNPYRTAGVGGGGALPMNEHHHQAVMAALLEGGSARHASASGGAGGEGGNGGDDDSDDDASSGGNARGGGNSGAPRRDEREQNENNHASNRSNNARDGFDDAAGAAARDNVNAAEAEEEDAGEAPLRRSLRIRSAVRGSNRPPARNNLPPRPRPALLAARMRRNHDVDVNDLPPDPEEAPWMVRRALRAAARAAAVGALANNNDASVDISDDDDVTFRPGPLPVFRLKKGNESLHSSGKRKSLDSNSNENHNESFDYSDDDDIDDDGYSTVSRDIDLLLHNSSSGVPEPSRNLWESHPRHSGETDADDNEEDNADDDTVCFPASWLRSGFKLAPCGNGLAMSAPPADDRGRVNRSFSVLREGPLKGMKGSFPYNCMGVSALLSIVSALLYSGASILDGSAVACDVDRVPFHELSLEQRKREFDSRLTDALSSLIFVAAEAGSLRYKEMLRMFDRQWARRCRRKGRVAPEEEDIHSAKRIALLRRTRVCEVCWWPTDVMNGGATIFPEGKDPQDVQYKTSFTNIRDIKSYVKTNLRSFKEPGGCALFLETIVHCHSKSIHLPPSFPLNCESFALGCKCSQTLKHFQAIAKNKSGGTNIMSMPEDNDCMTVEFFSLLLTGHVHHNYENWSADMFGIGILRINTNAHNKLGPRLLRPIKPIWICLGDLGYSTLFLDMKTFIGRTSTLDDPGKAFQLAHWNCWSGEMSKFRVITSMRNEGSDSLSGQENPFIIPCTSSDSEEEGRTMAESISARQHREQKRDAPMPWEQEERNDNSGGVNPSLKPISDDELQSVTFHPEDKKYYPGQYRRWRFNFGSAQASSADDDWTPFYRLHGRQRLIVEMKLAPRICALIRSRWPLATVRDFVPEGNVPIV